MLTASVATTTVNIAIATTSGFVNFPTSLTGSQIASPKMIALALVMSTPIAANANIVVGSATTWPDDLLALAAPEAREVRHVERQRGPEADHRGERRDEDRQELAERPELPGLREQRPEPVRLVHGPHEKDDRHDEDVRRGPVLDLAEEIHAAVDDEDVEAPEEQEREPLGRRVAGEPGAEERGPAREDRGEERVERLAADPGLDAEPAARDERAHERRQVRARGAVRGAREDRERGCRTSCPGCEFSRIGTSTIVLPRRIVKSACFQFMPAVHEARGQHVRRDAVRHARSTARRSCTSSRCAARRQRARGPR